VVTVHGRKDEGDIGTVWLGGRDQKLRDAVASICGTQGFAPALQDIASPAKSQTTFATPGKRGAGGGRLEIPRTLRDALIADTQKLANFAGAVQSAIANSVTQARLLNSSFGRKSGLRDTADE
jgi:phage replication-related protein YjqB (UPF0714/DUF867 family)